MRSMGKEIKLQNRTLISIMIFVFLTLLTSCKEDEVAKYPVLNTIQAVDADITTTTAKLKGEIQILGNQNILEYGIEISKNVSFNPSTTKGFTTPAATGQFAVDFTGLDPNTMYHYKAYTVINTAHVYSKNTLYFTTKN